MHVEGFGALEPSWAIPFDRLSALFLPSARKGDVLLQVIGCCSALSCGDVLLYGLLLLWAEA